MNSSLTTQTMQCTGTFMHRCWNTKPICICIPWQGVLPECSLGEAGHLGWLILFHIEFPISFHVLLPLVYIVFFCPFFSLSRSFLPFSFHFSIVFLVQLPLSFPFSMIKVFLFSDKPSTSLATTFCWKRNPGRGIDSVDANKKNWTKSEQVLNARPPGCFETCGALSTSS